MADVNPNDAIPATNASNTTRYFNLPLFISTDRPSWLVDWNGAMNEIDSILQDISTASEGAVADVATIQTQIDALSQAVQNLNSTVETAVADVASMQTSVDSHETRMDSIEADLITQNNLIKSLSDAVTTMQATVSTLNNRVTAIETTVSGYDARITSCEQASASASSAVAEVQTSLQSLSATVTSLSSTVNTHSSQIASLDARVTALEGGGSGGAGIPCLSDLSFTSEGVNLTTATTGATGTLFTATRDCWVIASAWVTLEYADSTNTTSKSVGLSIGNETICFANTFTAPGQSVSPYAPSDRDYSGLYRMKAGESITYTCGGTWGDGGASNVSVRVANA